MLEEGFRPFSNELYADELSIDVTLMNNSPRKLKQSARPTKCTRGVDKATDEECNFVATGRCLTVK